LRAKRSAYGSYFYFIIPHAILRASAKPS
jgi:hypothetical protein